MMFLAEYWAAGHPDDMHDDDDEGMDVTWVSEDAQKLVEKAQEELRTRFDGEDFELQVVPYDDRFPQTHLAVKMRYAGEGDDDWVAFFLIHPIEVI